MLNTGQPVTIPLLKVMVYFFLEESNLINNSLDNDLIETILFSNRLLSNKKLHPQCSVNVFVDEKVDGKKNNRNYLKSNYINYEFF